ncbi:hypothetical protein [Thiocapsa rosea]|uniref:Uncharacterized protein n=1 Tax=Thiocapsa rosea TaxID=69360 RepID=A0A495V527_9GAMM|nr:hypothetical protein [Thiocapsa rosea]RKT44501.1 hypothetical protein BDD21_1886 [Thiocapsa rosea]
MSKRSTPSQSAHQPVVEQVERRASALAALTAARSERAEASMRLTTHQRRLADVRNEIRGKEARPDYANDLTRLRREQETLAHDDTALREAVARCDAAIASAEETIREVDADCGDAEAAAAAEQRTLEAARTEVARLSGMIAESQDALGADDAPDAELAGLRREREDAMAAIAAGSGEATVLEELNRRIAEREGVIADALAAAETDLDERSQTLRGLRRRLAEVESVVSASETRLRLLLDQVWWRRVAAAREEYAASVAALGSALARLMIYDGLLFAQGQRPAPVATPQLLGRLLVPGLRDPSRVYTGLEADPHALDRAGLDVLLEQAREEVRRELAEVGLTL